MLLRRLCLSLLCLSAFAQANSTSQYYQADPAKLAALEAQRCAKLAKEDELITRRLTGKANNKSYDIQKMQQRQQVVRADFAKYCQK
ncbi:MULTISPECIES: hypothetical protein [Chitinibacter]|uniref:hypothetical protein n=1 Tax=Chitinibacter TaxID=230666 RepID=UPI0006463157|nr:MULTISPECIES: hypothetical protein [Chitinibacter]